MFPYKDENPTTITPYVTVGLIVLNAVAWALVQGFGSHSALIDSVCRGGLIPGELLGTAPVGSGVALAPGAVCQVEATPQYHTIVTSMFLHGGWFHLLGNMLFLWVFGNNIEDAMGHGRFVFFYLLAGVAAAAAQVAVQPASVVPMVGASGAISGVLGGYMLLYPRARVHTLVFLGLFVTTIDFPAYVMLGYWMVLQVLGGLPSLAGLGGEGGVAFWAHIGGFVAGLAMIRLFARPEYLARRPPPEPLRVRRRWP